MLQPLLYIGRQASRSDGQARRIAILEATLKLIVAEGIRGVRHRAVASLAQVPLASTTYYFSDIKELIHDALTFHVEKTMAANLALEKQSFAALGDFNAACLKDRSRRAKLVTMLSGFVCEHIKSHAKDREGRLLELAFHEEALRNPALAQAIVALDDAIFGPMMGFFSQIGASAPRALACQMLGLIRLLEYRYTVRPWDEIECQSAVTSLLESQFAAVSS